jgi:hypothetical protein
MSFAAAGLSVVGHHPIEVAVRGGEVPIRRHPFEDHNASLSHIIQIDFARVP